MTSSFSRTKLENLPDEILLEVCRYLLCVDILQSFFGLNHRMTRMITQYRHHVSLYKATFTQTSYLCTNVLPHIGSHIRSLLIDCYYAVLQEWSFAKYFDKNMPIMFPRLEKISLVSFRADALVAFLNSLHDLNHLVEVRLYGLFDLAKDRREAVLQTLLQANNNQLTTILIDDESHCLAFNDSHNYSNILKLRIKLAGAIELSYLFAAVPNVNYLDVTVDEHESEDELFYKMHLSSLLHVNDFRLYSTRRWWTLEELFILLEHLPNIQNLSLFISTRDKHLVSGNMILPLLPSTVQQFQYVVYYLPDMSDDEGDEIVASWPSSHPIRCLVSDFFWFIHTVPWHFTHMPLLLSFGKTISSQANCATGYDKQVEHLEITIDKNFTLNKSLGIIAQCNRVRKISIHTEESDDVVQEAQRPPPCLPKLNWLTQILFHGSEPLDIDSLSSILIASPNLWRLGLPFDRLMKLLENEQLSYLLRQRIMGLSIYEVTVSSETAISENHVSKIASIFTRLRDLDVDLSHLSSSTAITSDEDVSEDSIVSLSSFNSCQEECEAITPFSIESILLCLLKEFKGHKLTALCIDGRFHEKIESNTKQWLIDNSVLQTQQFDAVFYKGFKRLFIWM